MRVRLVLVAVVVLALGVAVSASAQSCRECLPVWPLECAWVDNGYDACEFHQEPTDPTWNYPCTTCDWCENSGYCLTGGGAAATLPAEWRVASVQVIHDQPLTSRITPATAVATITPKRAKRAR